MAQPRITKVPRSDAKSLDFVAPGRFYYVDAMGDLYFVHRRNKQLAQIWVDSVHGKGKYNVREARPEKKKPQDDEPN